MSDTATGLLIGMMLVVPAIAVPAVMELMYRRRERRDGLREER